MDEGKKGEGKRRVPMWSWSFDASSMCRPWYNLLYPGDCRIRFRIWFQVFPADERGSSMVVEGERERMRICVGSAMIDFSGKVNDYGDFIFVVKFNIMMGEMSS